MPAPSLTPPPAKTLPGAWHQRFVPLRWSGALQERQPVRMLPSGRLAPAVLPIVGSATWAVQSRDDVGGGVVGKLFGKGHQQKVALKEKSAMPKIELAQSRQCRHNSSTMKSKYYRVTVQESGEQKLFDTKAEIKAWASKATMTLQCDLTLSVLEVVEKEIQFNANYTTGEVEEVEA
jgi:hypothetical protein